MTDLADQDHDRDAPPRHRLYRDLASWWPLISPPEEYAEEAAFAASLLRMRAHRLARFSSSGAGAATTPSTSRASSR